MKDRLLLVDDEQDVLNVLSSLFRRRNMIVETADSGAEALWLLRDSEFDMVLCDLAMPDSSGIDVLKAMRSAGNETPFVIMTGVGTIETAVEAMKFGAYNYVTKPFKMQTLEAVIAQGIAHGRLHRQLQRSPEMETVSGPTPMVLGSSKVMQTLLETIERIASASVPVLITGETGTGKSLLAKHIHSTGPRAKCSMVTIDCGALPETLLESELFGHIKGAFTGAVSDRRGLLEEAQGGTVFLDEIGELSPAMQVKLLHAVQEKEIRPVGGNKTIQIDVQFITATNRDLAKEVAEGRFREDLYYRLSVITLFLPALRERRDDIIAFVAHFVGKYCQQYGKDISSVEPDAMEVLLQREWRGNIRELENVVERAVLLTSGNSITYASLSLGETAPSIGGNCQPIPLQKAVETAERKAIIQALKVAKDNRTRAAELLGIGRRTLYSKIDEYGI